MVVTPESLQAILPATGMRYHHGDEDYLNCKVSSDLILLYGVKAVSAFAVKGVGPLIVHRILAKTRRDLWGLLRDLMEYMDARWSWMILGLGYIETYFEKLF